MVALALAWEAAVRMRDSDVTFLRSPASSAGKRAIMRTDVQIQRVRKVPAKIGNNNNNPGYKAPA